MSYVLVYWRKRSSAALIQLQLTFPPLVFQESLKYRLLGSEGDIGSWGHEYVRYVQNQSN